MRRYRSCSGSRHPTATPPTVAQAVILAAHTMPARQGDKRPRRAGSSLAASGHAPGPAASSGEALTRSTAAATPEHGLESLAFLPLGPARQTHLYKSFV